MKNLLLLLFFCVLFFEPLSGQAVYKTPSGKRYHRASCHMVENVSKKVSDGDIRAYKLSPCKFCKPPVRQSLSYGFSPNNKAKGVKPSTAQCLGHTEKGARCKHKTAIANGYCYQHTAQAPGAKSSSKLRYSTSSSSSTYVGLCGARTQSGGSCKRKVKGGGRCYQHD